MSLFGSIVVTVLIGLFAVLSLLPDFFQYSEEDAIVQLQD